MRSSLRSASIYLVLAYLMSGCTSHWASREMPAVAPSDADFRSVLMLSDMRGHLASGFLLAVAGRQYVVTARHFAAYMRGQDSVDIFVNDGWLRTPTQLIGHTTGEVDISVFSFRR
ncbi:MAG TPA: hypothetical protein VGM92_09090, partial [Candidatus Kapabacteria bacterium]